MLTKDLFQRLSPRARILFIRLRSMGDCLLLTAPIRALKAQFPAFRITILVEPRFVDCFDANPDVDEILSAPDKWSFAARLLTRRFDAIVNLHGGPTSLLYSCLAWGNRIGAEHYQAARLYQCVVPRRAPDAHTVESTMALMRWLGLQSDEPPKLRYEFHPEEAARMRQKLNDRPYAVMHPGSVLETKRWQARRDGELAGCLARRGLTIVLKAGAWGAARARGAPGGHGGPDVVVGLRIPSHVPMG